MTAEATLALTGLPAQPGNWQPEWYADACRRQLHIRTDQAHRLWNYHPQTGVYTQTEAEWAVHRKVSELVAQTRKLVPRPRQGREVVDLLKRMIPSITADNHAIGFLNGVLRWPDLTLLPHSPDYLLTHAIPHKYDPAAQPTRFRALLNDLLTADGQTLLQEVMGAMFRAGKQPKTAVVLVGPSNTGKSTIQELLARTVGEDNISALTPHQLAADKFAAAQLYGKSANIVADLPLGNIPDTSAWKQVTGNDLLEADIKYSQPIRFRSTATWLMSTNELPSAGQDRTSGYYGRILPLPMDQVIPDDRLNPLLTDSIMADPAEVAGIINWGLAGLHRLVGRQLKYTVPVSVKQAADRYRLEQNHHFEFLADCYEPHAAGRITRANLKADYEKWCERQGQKPWSGAYLYRRVREIWGNDRKHGGEYTWKGHQRQNPSHPEIM